MGERRNREEQERPRRSEMEQWKPGGGTREKTNYIYYVLHLKIHLFVLCNVYGESFWRCIYSQTFVHDIIFVFLHSIAPGCVAMIGSALGSALGSGLGLGIGSGIGLGLGLAFALGLGLVLVLGLGLALGFRFESDSKNVSRRLSQVH